MNNILKLNPFEEKFSAYIGSLIHYILSAPALQQEIPRHFIQKTAIYLITPIGSAYWRTSVSGTNT